MPVQTYFLNFFRDDLSINLAILQKDLANPDLINPPKLSWVKLPSRYLKEKLFWKLVPQMWL